MFINKPTNHMDRMVTLLVCETQTLKTSLCLQRIIAVYNNYTLVFTSRITMPLDHRPMQLFLDVRKLETKHLPSD